MNEQQQIGALEAMLFAHADPVEAARLADALRVEPEEAVRLLKKLQKKLDEEERRMIFDTGAYNDIVKTYCKKAMEMHEMSEEDIQAVLGNIGYLFDTIRATEL